MPPLGEPPLVEALNSDALHERGELAVVEQEGGAGLRVAGEVRSVRIVPRAGADALEVTVSDGRAAVTGVFLGRRKIGGLSPGRKVVLEGVVLPDGKQHQIYNPMYTLL